MPLPPHRPHSVPFELHCRFILLLPILLGSSCTAEEDWRSNRLFDPTYDYTYHDTHITIIDEKQKQRAISACKQSENMGKSIAIFGGSHSCSTSSWMLRDILKQYLDAKITTYSIGGQGFSSLQGSIQEQVAGCESHDIYILWASTNDFHGNQEPGYVTDYTEADNFNEKRRISQCGGINYCIQKLRRKNPQAKIFLFGSLKFFTSERGFNWYTTATNDLGYTYPQYIQLQESCALQAGIPFYHQYKEIPINLYNFKMCFTADHLHHNATGYANIAYHQLEFLATH